MVPTKGPGRSSPHPQGQIHGRQVILDWGWSAAAGSACSRSSNSRRCPGSGSSAWPAPTGPRRWPRPPGSGSRTSTTSASSSGRDDVDVVYIATPPFLHHAQAMAALEAGKHVIVEKPLAMTVAQADELIAAARRRDRLLVANLMQRYNPLFDAVRRLVEARVLGEVLHGSFENYASDENLPAEHWFWDRAKSGGIFVEHGVHFFDLFAGWLGRGPGRGGPGRGPAGDRDRGARPLHGPLRRRGPGQLLPRLPPGRADGPPGTPAGLRAGRRDPPRLGADPGPDSRGGGRAADPGPVRPVPRRPARRRPPPTAARTAPAGAGARRSTPTRSSSSRPGTARRSRRSTAGCSGR